MWNRVLALMVGVWLAATQVSLFLSLQLLLSSAYLTFLVVILAWLAGAAVGVWIPSGRWTILLMMVAGTMPYLSFGLLAASPYDTSLMAVHAVGIWLTALYAGHFFQQERRNYDRIGALFFWENNGFVLGLIVGVMGFVFHGRSFLYLAPACGLMLVLVATGARAVVERAGQSSRSV